MVTPNQEIAFLATTETIGVEGSGRLGVEYHLYIMDINDQKPTRVLSNIYYPNEVSWSPDNEWIAIAGQIKMESGIWLFSPITKELIQVDDGYFESLVWSPDSSKIAVIYCIDVSCDDTEIRVYNIDL